MPALQLGTGSPASSSVTIAEPRTVSTDSGWNCTEAKPGPRSACSSPPASSRLTSMPCAPSSAAAGPSHRPVKLL